LIEAVEGTEIRVREIEPGIEQLRVIYYQDASDSKNE